MPVTSERMFVVQVPESQAKQLDTIWNKVRSYYGCFMLVHELKRHYELAKANSAHLEDGHSSDDKEFVQKVDSVLKTLGDKGIEYPASNVLKALTKTSEPERFNTDYVNSNYTERDILDMLMKHVLGRGY